MSAVRSIRLLCSRHPGAGEHGPGVHFLLPPWIGDEVGHEVEAHVLPAVSRAATVRHDLNRLGGRHPPHRATEHSERCQD